MNLTLTIHAQPRRGQIRLYSFGLNFPAHWDHGSSLPLPLPIGSTAPRSIFADNSPCPFPLSIGIIDPPTHSPYPFSVPIGSSDPPFILADNSHDHSRNKVRKARKKKG